MLGVTVSGLTICFLCLSFLVLTGTAVISTFCQDGDYDDLSDIFEFYDYTNISSNGTDYMFFDKEDFAVSSAQGYQHLTSSIYLSGKQSLVPYFTQYTSILVQAACLHC